MVTGIDSIGVTQITHDAEVQRNTILNVTDNGVWVQGGCSSAIDTAQCWQSNGILVAGNRIHNVTESDGIRFSESHHSTAINNKIENAHRGCINLNSENSSIGFDGGIEIIENICKNTLEAGGVPAIDIGLAATLPTVRGNRVYGSHYTYAISIASGVPDSHIEGNNLDAGTSGTLRNPAPESMV